MTDLLLDKKDIFCVVNVRKDDDDDDISHIN